MQGLELTAGVGMLGTGFGGNFYRCRLGLRLRVGLSSGIRNLAGVAARLRLGLSIP